NTLTSRFDGPSLINTGKILLKIHSATRMNIPDISEVLLFYEEALLLVKEITDKVFLVVMCEVSANPSLVTMSIGIGLEDLKAWAQTQHAAPAPPRPEAEAKPAPAPIAKKPTPEELMESGPLADTLSDMQTALARVMGPMAGIIFMEALGQWIDSGTPSEATLGELVKILAKEIKDPERIKRFRDLVSPHLRTRK
ncbi:MAG TPA: hypothetical protein VEU07_14135, partial [Candidatus Acidoferrum sp.]|nr:hypothetical protein [Candidatus Acidoferrum sp.]